MTARIIGIILTAAALFGVALPAQAATVHQLDVQLSQAQQQLTAARSSYNQTVRVNKAIYKRLIKAQQTHDPRANEYYRAILVARANRIAAQKWLAAVINKVTTIQHRVLIARYGTANLPVTPAEIARYELSVSDVRRIIAASHWAAEPFSQAVINCESGGNYGIVASNGHYGAWQFAYESWLGNGGGRFAERADYAPKWAQDLIAYDYWSNAGWGPWECAGMVR